MKRRGPALMAAAINLALAVAAFSWPSNPEPVYKGKKLSEWLSLHSHWRFSKWLEAGDANGRRLLRLEDYQEAQAVEAVQAIGTNAFPCLLRWVSYETPRWRTWAIRRSAKLPSLVQNSRFCRWLCDDSEAQKRAVLAVEGFYILGPDAVPVVKDLTRIDKAKDHTPRRQRTSHGYVYVSSPASCAWIAMVYIGKRLPAEHADVAASNTVKRAAVDRSDVIWFQQK